MIIKQLQVNRQQQQQQQQQQLLVSMADDAEQSNYPVWLDDDHIDPKWIDSKLMLGSVDDNDFCGYTTTSCHVQDISNDTRKGSKVRDGSTLKLAATLQKNNTKDDTTTTTTTILPLVIKQAPESGRQLSMQLGLAREALFYRDLVSELPVDSIVPKIYYSYGNFETGEKVVVMEDLSDKAVDSAVFFGKGSPHNWKRDLDKETSRVAHGQKPSASLVTETTFRAIARIHGKFWKRNDMLLTNSKHWLRGQRWLEGKGRGAWEASQSIIQNIWKTADLTTIKWDPLLKSLTEKAVNGISWESQLQRLNTNTN